MAVAAVHLGFGTFAEHDGFFDVLVARQGDCRSPSSVLTYKASQPGLHIQSSPTVPKARSIAAKSYLNVFAKTELLVKCSNTCWSRPARMIESWLHFARLGSPFWQAANCFARRPGSYTTTQRIKEDVGVKPCMSAPCFGSGQLQHRHHEEVLAPAATEVAEEFDNVTAWF